MIHITFFSDLVLWFQSWNASDSLEDQAPKEILICGPILFDKESLLFKKKKKKRLDYILADSLISSLLSTEKAASLSLFVSLCLSMPASGFCGERSVNPKPSSTFAKCHRVPIMMPSCNTSTTPYLFQASFTHTRTHTHSASLSHANATYFLVFWWLLFISLFNWVLLAAQSVIPLYSTTVVCDAQCMLWFRALTIVRARFIT